MSIKRDQNKTIQDNIARATRPRTRIDSPTSLVLSFREELAPAEFRLQNIRYSGIIFSASQYLGSFDASGNTAYTLTSGNEDSGSGGVFATGTTSVYEDTSKAWAVNQWVDHYIITSGRSYQIRSNTDIALTLYDLKAQPENGDYSIVPYKNNKYLGAFIVPDSSIPAKFKIISNTNNVLAVEGNKVSVYAGELSSGMGFAVLAGDGSTVYYCPANTVLDGLASAQTVSLEVTDEDGNPIAVDVGFGATGTTEAVDLVGWYIFMVNGDAAGETGTITAYTPGSGFTITGLTGAPASGDSFIIQADLNSFDLSSGVLIYGQYDLFDVDFDNEGWEDLQKTYIISPDGDFHLDQADSGYNARYTVEYYAAKASTIPIHASFSGTYRIVINNTEQLNSVTNGSISVTPGWNRFDIYYYTPDGGALYISGITKSIGYYFTMWRDPSPGAPTWVSTSGFSGETAQEGQVELRWSNANLVGAEGGTEVWYKASGDASFTFLERIPSATQAFTHVGLNGNATYIYKLRHYTAQGDISNYSAERNGVVAADVPADGAVLIVDVLDADLYYASGETVSIYVSSQYRLADVPTVTVGGSPASLVADTSTDHTYTTWSFVATGSEGNISISASGTTVQGSSVNGSKTIVFDFTAPTLNDGYLILDSNSNVGNGDVLYCVDPRQVFIRATTEISDTSGVASVRTINAFFGIGSVADVGVLGDTNLSNSDLNGVSFTGYVLTDASGSTFTILYYDNSSGFLTWHLASGTPANGAYTVSKYSTTSTISWSEIDFLQDVNMAHSLMSNTPWTIAKIPDSMPITNGFRVYMAVSDLAGNISDIISDDIYYNTQATSSAIVSFRFVDAGTSELFTNQNGWFNQATVRLEITATTNGGELPINAIYYSVDGGAYTEIIGGGTTEVAYATLNEVASGTVEFYATTDAMSGPISTSQVNYRWDKTSPSWTPSAIAAVGGFNRVILGWTADPSDALSGPSHIEVYRNTSNVASGSTLVAITDYLYKGFIDSEVDYGTNYYYWGKAVDIAGNKSDYKVLGGPVAPAQIVSADVDGALRIQNPYNIAADTDDWQNRYGIRVPIEAVTFRTGTLESGEYEIDSLANIQYSANGSSWTNVSSPTFNGASITVSGFSVTDDTTYTIAFTPVQDAYYWRVVFAGPFDAQINSQILSVDFNSILAADLIVAGVLRLETGLSIWSGSYDGSGVKTGGGVTIDQAGLVLWDASGATTVALYGTAASGNIAVFGKNAGRQMFVTEDGDVLIDGGALTVGSGVNIVPNSDAQAGSYYWTLGDEWTRSSAAKKFGTHSFLLSAGGAAATTDTILSDLIAIDRTLDYMVSFYANMDRISGIGVIQIAEYNSSSVFITAQTVASISANTSGFERYEQAVTSFNASTAYIAIRAYGSYGPGNPEFEMYLDGFQIELIDNTSQGASPWRPAGYTSIDGNIITTGKIQSVDGKTYFDLDNNYIKMVNGTTTLEISAEVGLAGSYGGNKTFDIGIRNGRGFFRGGIIHKRLARIPLYAYSFGYDIMSIDDSITGFTDSRGLIFANGFLWASDYDNGDIKKIDPNTFTVVATYNVGINHGPWGMAWDGTYIWIACREAWSIVLIDPSDGSVITEIELGSGIDQRGPVKIAWDGTYMWVTILHGGTVSGTKYPVYRIHGATLATTGITFSDHEDALGICFDGEYMWVAPTTPTSGTNEFYYKIDVSGTTAVKSSSLSGFFPGEVTYDGRNVWACNRNEAATDNLLRNLSTGNEYVSISTPASYAISFDGELIWVKNSITLYAFSIKTKEVQDSLTVSSGSYGGQIIFDGQAVYAASTTAVDRILT